MVLLMLRKTRKNFILLVVALSWLGAARPSLADPQWHKRCHGTGYITCHVCHGEASMTKGLPCHECHSTGKLECPRCKGSGILFTFLELQKG